MRAQDGAADVHPGHPEQGRQPAPRAPAEAGRGEYGWLPQVQRQRSTIIKPGTMIVSQPQLPVPVVIEFPFPAWATRVSETAGTDAPGRRDQPATDEELFDL